MTPNTIADKNGARKFAKKKKDADDYFDFEDCEPLLLPESVQQEEETSKEEAYHPGPHGTLDKHGDDDDNNRKVVKRSLSRRLSQGISRELLRRQSSSVKENLPKTPSGWAVLLSSIATAVLGYEVRLQTSLTCPPLVFGQTQEGPLRTIYERLTSTKDSILTRNIRPSLFVGTRSVATSTAAFIMGGPPSTDEHVRFRQVLTMSQDGATIALDWELPPLLHVHSKSARERQEQVLNGPIHQPVVLILHGINNDSSFGYVRSLMRECTNHGWIAAGMNFRGCGGAPVTTPRGYTGAYTGDLRGVVRSISARLADGVPMFLVGNSLGANLVTKYLGEEGLSGTLPKQVAGGISLGNPLHIHSKHLGFPWGHILSLGARKGILQNLRYFLPMTKSPQYRRAIRNALLSNTIGEFDEAMAPIFIRNEPSYPFSVKIGYKNGENYWQDASSYRLIRHVPVPLLLITSQDDFLVYKGSTGKMAYSVSNPNVMVVKTKCGGHLGWHESLPERFSVLGFGTSWANAATADFIEAILYSRSKRQEERPDRDSASVHKVGNEAKTAADQIRSRL